jgi:hypothetical protein
MHSSLKQDGKLLHVRAVGSGVHSSFFPHAAVTRVRDTHATATRHGQGAGVSWLSSASEQALAYRCLGATSTCLGLAALVAPAALLGAAFGPAGWRASDALYLQVAGATLLISAPVEWQLAVCG